MIVMADVGTIPTEARQKLIDWVKKGGTLVRFAGQRLAAAENDEELLPVRLRLANAPWVARYPGRSRSPSPTSPDRPVCRSDATE
jgi:hypothetical protein